MRSDEELMAAYVSGDRSAMDLLYRRYRDQLVATFTRRCGSRADAEDLVQQTFLRVHLAAATYRLGEAFRPWVYTIAHNLRKDSLRSAGRRSEHPAELEHMPATDCTARPLEHRETVRVVRASIQRLSPTLRDTVERHYLEERDFEEVARISGVRQGTLRVRAHRACSLLREIPLLREIA